MSIFGFDKTGYYSGIQDGELVKCILLERKYPGHYLKHINEREKAEKETAEALGIDPLPIVMSHKEGGISWDFAILERFNEDIGDYESTLLFDDKGEPILPDMNIFGSYIQHTPERILNNNLGYMNIIRGGLDKFYNGSTNVIIGQHFPNTLPEKDWSTGMTADRITDENLEEFRELFHRETGRQAHWNSIMSKWDKLSEEKAIEKLEDMIASRLLLYVVDSKGRIAYVKPQPGMIFNAKVSKKGKYIDLIGFEWDREAGKYQYYSFGVDSIQIEDQELAKKLIKLHNEKKSLETALVAVSGEFPDDDEDLPF
jgi:hypothetical protein